MRYFFHLADQDRDFDRDGLELPDDESAKAEAVRYAGQLLQDRPNDLWNTGQSRVEVTDESGALRWLVISMAIDAPTLEETLEPRGSISFKDR